MAELRFVLVSPDDTSGVVSFLERAGSALSGFRYYGSRPLDVIAQHEVTLLLMEGEVPVAYGHLDREEGVVWLGIAVAQPDQGRGLGRLMMERLVEEGHRRRIATLRLSVDEDNRGAIRLYRSFGFAEVERRDGRCFMEAPTEG